MKIIFSSKRFLLSLLLTGSTWICSYAQRTMPDAYLSATPVSYVRTWDAVSPETNCTNITTSATPDKFKMATQYLDGLGRPVQTVIKQGSLITGQSPIDMVGAVEYDEFGREQFKYLPSPANNSGGNTHINDGLFKLNPFQQQAAFYGDPNGVLKGQGESYFYGQTQFDGSPLNRVTKTLAPGNSWQGIDRGISLKYYINTTNDAVRIWNVANISNSFGTYSSTGAYAAGQLFKNVTIDENGKQVIEFKDKEGQVILKKVQLTATTDDGNGSGHSGWLCTYYIYDDLNQLRCVIQPRAVELISSNWILTDATILAEQCFRYEYDERQRMIMKKVPGAGEVFMVYDARDRLVMTQDANLRAINKWMITLYDELNRPVQTGLLLNTFTSPAKTFAQHLTTANTSTAYPFAVSAPPTTTYWEFLTKTGYDNYSGIQGGLTNGFDNTWASQFNSTYNTAPLYVQQQIASLQTTGMVTWSQTKILNSSSYLYSVNIYDDKGRAIQVKSKNIVNGTDVVTIQYNWAGQPLINVRKQEKAGSPSQTSVLVTQFSYDELGRLTKTEEKLSNTLVNGNAMSAYKTVSKLEYDALGQLKRKKIGAAPLETLTYDYNIRGWLLGENRDYAKSTTSTANYFGFDLGYDKNTIAPTGGSSIGTFATPAYNGNIEGMVWKSKGDGEIRKYDFNYDAVNRLMKADFNQYTSASFNKTAGVDFSISMGDGVNANSAYDANGNIKAMNQTGLKINASSAIDQLSYTYQTNSNKLSKVVDAVVDKDSKLGDFKYDPATKQSSDYLYDVNGNLTKDNNKAISSITYNYLNLPSLITITGKGTITYTYDAGGNKLKKVTVDNTVTPSKTTTTLYIGGAVYENDVLQFIPHEEGRIRFKPAAGAVPAALLYDYFLKDHLGNVRMVLTEQKDTSFYPPASMETAQASTEEALYANLPETRTAKPAGYPTDNYTNPNNNVARVKAATGSQKTGPSIILKVMAGDQFNIRVSSWYKKNGATPSNTNTIISDLVANMINSLTSPGAILHGNITATQLTNSGVISSSATSFLNTQPPPGTTKPKAYLNWVLLDEQFKLVEANSSAEQVGNDLEFKVHVKNNMPISKSGYLYVYVSNETSNIDVYFDNLQVTQIRGPILEETHYYPFGLTMAGISSKSAGSLINKKGYNGNELQNKEFSDGSGLEMYDFNARTYDRQIGRFIQIDPNVEEGQESINPYHFTFDNPIRYNDVDGREPDDIIIKGKNNSSVTLKTDLINISVNASSLGVDFGGNYSLQGEDILSAGLDIVGVLDPTGIADGVNASLQAKNGDWLSAGISVLGIIPYIGDVGKIGKIGKDIKIVEKAVEAVKAEKRAAKLSEVERVGKDFTKAGKEAVVDVNKAKHGGVVKCEGCGTKTVPATKSTKGTTPSKAERQVDHIQPKSKGGSGTPNNGQVLCRGCNIKKADN